MFKEIVYSTKLTTDAANDFYSNITGDSFNGDISFLSTLRALVAPRMKENDALHLAFYSSDYSQAAISTVTRRNAIQAVFRTNPGQVTVHNFCNSRSADNQAWLELVESAPDYFNGWHRLNRVTDFYKKSFPVLCFINPDQKSAIVFAENLNVPKMHYLQCSIFAIMPWYFDPKAGVLESEMALIESLRGKSIERYEECISAIASKYDFRSERIRKLLAGFETRYESMECDRVRREIQSCDEELNILNSRIVDYLRQRREYEIRLLGLETKIASGSDESEIMDYFLRNERLAVHSVNGSSITFVVKAYVEYFDEDLAERVIDNNHSYIYTVDGHQNIRREDIKKLMTAVFLDQTIRIKVCAAYCFNMDGRVQGIMGYGYDADFDGYMPNPHIDGYACLGSYQSSINEMLRRNDYIGAIEQCAASCKSINFNDSTVMARFMRNIYAVTPCCNMRCFELPDGSVVTPVDAIKWIKEQEAQANE